MVLLELRLFDGNVYISLVSSFANFNIPEMTSNLGKRRIPLPNSHCSFEHKDQLRHLATLFFDLCAYGRKGCSVIVCGAKTFLFGKEKRGVRKTPTFSSTFTFNPPKKRTQK